MFRYNTFIQDISMNWEIQKTKIKNTHIYIYIYIYIREFNLNPPTKKKKNKQKNLASPAERFSDETLPERLLCELKIKPAQINEFLNHFLPGNICWPCHWKIRIKWEREKMIITGVCYPSCFRNLVLVLIIVQRDMQETTPLRLESRMGRFHYLLHRYWKMSELERN